MDFCSLKLRDKAHAPTQIHKQKRKLYNKNNYKNNNDKNKIMK